MGLFKKKETLIEYIDSYIKSNSSYLQIKTKAIDKAIDLISKCLAICSLEVYKLKNKKIEKVKDDLFYKLNISPNDNDYAFDFWYKVWNKFFYDQEVLILELKHKLYVAEDFSVDDIILSERSYSNVYLLTENNSMFKLNKKFNANEVIHLKLSNNKTLELLNNYYGEIGKFIKIAGNNYKHNNIIKWILGIPNNPLPIKNPKTGEEITYEEYTNKIVGNLFSDEESILLLSKSLSLDKINSTNKVDSKDYLDLVNKFEESVADSFLIPRDVYFGKVGDKSSAEGVFFTQCIKPYLRLLEQALNSRIIKKSDYLAGSLIKANMNSIKYHNIIDNATNVDKLYADGFSHNDIRYFMDLVEIDEEWANEHRITKNYSEDVSTKGGD